MKTLILLTVLAGCAPPPVTYFTSNYRVYPSNAAAIVAMPVAGYSGYTVQ